MTIYKVKMLRWGNPKIYYILGYYTTEEGANEHGESEYKYRGSGKYTYKITEHILDIDQNTNDEYIFLK